MLALSLSRRSPRLSGAAPLRLRFVLSVLAGLAGTWPTALLAECTAPANKLKPMEQVQIRSRVYFAEGRAIPLPESAPILDEIVAALARFPEILCLEVRGYARDPGSRLANQRLSERRAAAVRASLIRRGAAPGRLWAQGAGPALGEGDSAADRMYSRRVEFVPLEDPSERARQAKAGQEACLRCNGAWGPHGITGQVGCLCRTSDGGRPCTKASECEARCLIPWDAALRLREAQWPVNQSPPVDLGVPPGACAEFRTSFGCHGWLEERPTPQGPMNGVRSACLD